MESIAKKDRIEEVLIDRNMLKPISDAMRECFFFIGRKEKNRRNFMGCVF